MNTVSQPPQTFRKWVCRVFGVLILLLLGLSLVGLILFFGFSMGTRWIHKTTLLHNLVAIGFGGFLMAALGLWLVQKGWQKEKKTEESASAGAASSAQPLSSLAPVSSARGKSKRWSSCNILHAAGDANRLWQFDAKGGGFVLKREHHSALEEALPFNLAAKSWRSLFQPKLNIAWLPPENVFFRVIELPKSNFEETLAMVELQLEKLSPLPLAQIVWMIHALSGAPAASPAQPGNAKSAGSETSAPAGGDLQTVIVVIAARHAVEEFLGKLEGRGYLADRLEAPMLDELEATPATADGAWIHPTASAGQNIALVAWRFGGALRNLSFVVLAPGGDRAKGLKAQLAQLAWAGELEGWLAAPPAWHLVAEGAVAAEWEGILRASLGEPVQTTPPPPPAELAAHTARRAAQANPRATLLPQEFAMRYHQQFVDRLWLRGLAAVGVLYIICVVIYFGAVRVQAYRTRQVEMQVAALDGSYTNALQVEARYRVLKERRDLKYAALDCWKVVAEALPAGLTLQRMSFADGQTLALNGTVTPDQIDLITRKDGFYDTVKKAKMNGQAMFDSSGGDNLTYNQAGNRVNWRFSLPLKEHGKQPESGQ